ncbi:MAG: chromosomal replication initiator protein DnaA, partial [Bacteroidetes bacterium]
KVVCEYYNISLELIQSKTRKREIVQARQIAMYFSKSLTKSSLATIGAKIGGKDHATVLHACKTVNNLIDTDKRFKMQVNELEKKLKV